MDEEPTQETGAGLEIPVPTRGVWERALGKAAKPVEHEDEDEEAPPDPEAGNNGDG